MEGISWISKVKSRTEQVMKPINVELTMEQVLGLSESYYKPTEKEVLEDYLKAVPLLTINDNNNNNNNNNNNIESLK
jgi:hypothetical protein